MFEVKSLSYNYKFGNTAYSDVSFKIERHGLFCIFGEEESGKTSLLNTIAGIINPTKGGIYLEGQNINNLETKKRNICFLQPQNIFFKNKTLFYNLSYPLLIRGTSKETIREKINTCCNHFYLNEFMNKKVKALDENIYITAAFARLTLREANIYLIDDPFKNLKEKDNLFKKFFPLIKFLSEKAYVIYATSYDSEVYKLNTNTLVLNYGVHHQTDLPENLKNYPSSCYLYELFNKEFVRKQGFLSKTDTPDILELNSDENLYLLDKKGLLNDIYINTDVIVYETYGNDKKNIKIYDPISEKLIYFNEIN